MNVNADLPQAEQARMDESGPSAIQPAGVRTVRLRRIESLRAVAALAVVACHAYARVNGFVFDSYAQRVVLGGGLYGVYIFFALSGYLLYLPFARRDVSGGPQVRLSAYARNRALRVFPLYYVALAILLVVNGGTLDIAGRFALFGQNFSDSLVAKAVDGPMWSLVVELHFYLLLPILAWGIGRLARGSARRAGAVILLLAAASIIASKADLRPHDVWAYSLPATFQYFVPGLLVALVHARIGLRRPAALDHPLARADLALLASLPVWAIVSWDYEWAPLAAIACFLLVAAVALPLRRDGVDRVFDWKPLAWVGVVSYSLYIWHVPVLRWLPSPPVANWRGFGWMLALALPVCLLTAAVSYRLVEAPPQRLRVRWVGAAASLGPRHPLVPKPARPWLLVLGAALALRVAVLALHRTPSLGADATDYDRLGRLIADGRGFGTSLLAAGAGPTSFRPPLYPIVLGGIYRATGGSINAARIVQVFLGVAAVALIGFIAHQLLGRRAGLAAAAIAAVYPPFVLVNSSLMSETLFLLLELGAVALAVDYWREPVRRWAPAGIGLLTGLAVLARPAGAALVVGLALLVWGRPWRARRAVIPALVVVLVAALTVTPWIVRNARQFHTFVPVSTIDAFDFAGVYNDQAAADKGAHRALFRPPSAVPAYASLFSDRSLGEVELANRLRDGAQHYLREHPSYAPQVVLWNSVRLFEVRGHDVTRDVYADGLGYGSRWADAATVAWWALVALAVVGVLALCSGASRQQLPKRLWIAPLLLWLGTVIVFGNARFRIPIEPYVMLLAAAALATRWDARAFRKDSGENL